MEIEEFKKVPGFENYWVSNLARVISTRYNKKKFLAQAFDGNDYQVVTLYNGPIRRTLKVSTIVAIAFLGHKAENDHNVIIKFIDGNKSNPKLKNLQIVKRVEHKHTGVRYNKTIQKWRVDVCYEGEKYYVGLFNTEPEAINAYEHKLNKLIAKSKKIF